MNFFDDESFVEITKHLRVSFQRTLRIPDDDKTYPLPPGLGTFPIYRVEDYKDTVPATWSERGGYFFPMYQREAMWISFDSDDSRPSAVVVGIGNVNAMTGRRFHPRLNKNEQNYLVCPDQPWLDGIKAGDGFIKQFVAMPLGMGYTVEEQLTGQAKFGGLQFAVYGLKPKFFPRTDPLEHDVMLACSPVAESSIMGLGAGGKMEQSIYPDDCGWEKWNHKKKTQVAVHIADSVTFRDITGEEPPATPISAKMYSEHGYPWFKLYDEHKGDVPSRREAQGSQVRQGDGQEEGVRGAAGRWEC